MGRLPPRSTLPDTLLPDTTLFRSCRFETQTEPYAGYHGIDCAEEFGPQAFAMRARSECLRDFGAAMAPQNAFYILQGVETLPLRMERHMANTLKVLDYLTGEAAVSWVLHPDLPEHPDHADRKSTRLNSSH